MNDFSPAGLSAPTAGVPQPTPYVSADGRQWWNGHAWVPVPAIGGGVSGLRALAEAMLAIAALLLSCFAGAVQVELATGDSQGRWVTFGGLAGAVTAGVPLVVRFASLARSRSPLGWWGRPRRIGEFVVLVVPAWLVPLVVGAGLGNGTCPPLSVWISTVLVYAALGWLWWRRNRRRIAPSEGGANVPGWRRR